MKELLFVLVLALGFGCTSAFASVSGYVAGSAASGMACADNMDGFYIQSDNKKQESGDTARNIDVKDLPAHIQETLAIEYKNYLVKSADVEMVEDGVYVYTVTLVDAENLETTVMFTQEVQLV